MTGPNANTVRRYDSRALGFTQYEPKPAGRGPDAHACSGSWQGSARWIPQSGHELGPFSSARPNASTGLSVRWRAPFRSAVHSGMQRCTAACSAATIGSPSPPTRNTGSRRDGEGRQIGAEAALPRAATPPQRIGTGARRPSTCRPTSPQRLSNTRTRVRSHPETGSRCSRHDRGSAGGAQPFRVARWWRRAGWVRPAARSGAGLLDRSREEGRDQGGPPRGSSSTRRTRQDPSGRRSTRRHARLCGLALHRATPRSHLPVRSGTGGDHIGRHPSATSPASPSRRSKGSRRSRHREALRRHCGDGTVPLQHYGRRNASWPHG
jgi:hypothetical protein